MFTPARILHRFDPWIMIPSLILLATSAVVLFSIDHAEGGGDRAAKQLIFAAGSLVLCAIVANVRSIAFEAYGPWAYCAGVILLIAVLVFGTTINGTTGWFVIGPVTFQPVELVKIFFVWGLSWLFGRYGGQTKEWKPIVLSGGMLAVLVGLVCLQPDFGSAMVFVLIWLGMLLVVHRTWWHLGVVAIGLALSAVVVWFLLADYQQDRILAFVDPGRDPLRSGYNVQQSIIATGSGGLFGRGLGLGPQSQLHFLPEQSTDFIFSVIAEELGLLGAGTVIVLFAIILWRLNTASSYAKGAYASLLAHGILIYFLGQISINIGMNMGIAPVTGLPLPLVSAGGSSLLASLLGLGLVQSVAQSTIS